MDTKVKTLILIPAHNEAESIARTIESVLGQVSSIDLIVVIPNGCTDGTAEIARSYSVEVLELPKLAHRKSEALNIAWNKYAHNFDIVISMDGDTRLASNALADWKRELLDPTIGGSSSKFTMIDHHDFLSKLQKSEYSAWTDRCLKKGYTPVLSGTGCAMPNKVLNQVAQRDDREGPWSYNSQVEDFELTCQIRSLGYQTIVSPTVRAYTDSMRTMSGLWSQRMKWQVGTIEDLLHMGWTKITRPMWLSQIVNFFGVFLTLLWVVVMVDIVRLGEFRFEPLWLTLPLLVILNDVKASLRIPHRDKKDVLLASLWLPHEGYVLLRQCWTVVAWKEVLMSKVTRKRKDRWAIQYQSEAK